MDKDLVNHVHLIDNIQNLVKSIRAKEFDVTLYASVSLWFLQISKQPFQGGTLPLNYLSMDWTDNGICVSKNGIEILQLSKCEYCPEIEALLRELEKS